MTPNGNNRIGPLNQVLGRVMADRKKSVLAIALVTVMVVMWGRVLTGRKPKPAAATTVPQQEKVSESEPRMKVRFTELPRIEGRNDCISRDFFSAEALTGFRRDDATSRRTSTDPEVRNVSSGPVQEVVAKVAQRLKLEAVLWSENPKAFVNDQLLQVGDTLTLKDGTTSYVFEVLRIQTDSVLVGCSGRQLTLKIAQSHDVSD
jgi:hypothetical protein